MEHQQKKSSGFPPLYDHSGWLHFRTKETNSWKRRFFVLVDNMLFVGVAPNATKLEKVIQLQDTNVALNRKSSLKFDIIDHKKMREFRASHMQEWTNWTQKISHASKLKIEDVYQLRLVL